MIKYNTQLGAKHLNMEARELKDGIKQQIKGMHCRKCKQDTVITFVDDGYGYLKEKVNACCLEFEERINKKLYPQRYK